MKKSILILISVVLTSCWWANNTTQEVADSNVSAIIWEGIDVTNPQVAEPNTDWVQVSWGSFQ